MTTRFAKGRLTLKSEMIHAAAMDEGMRSMRAAGRKVWNREDYNACARESARLYEFYDKQHHDLHAGRDMLA